MTTVLHIPARLDAPIACDMSTAQDTPDERFAEYVRLFERALASRERRADAVMFTFRGDSDVRATVEDLARREAACCPFLDYRVDTAGDDVVWTITTGLVGDGRAGVDAILDAFYELPDHGGAGLDGYFTRLADRGLEVTEADGERFELRSAG